jgi:hypothetical protein
MALQVPLVPMMSRFGPLLRAELVYALVRPVPAMATEAAARALRRRLQSATVKRLLTRCGTSDLLRPAADALCDAREDTRYQQDAQARRQRQQGIGKAHQDPEA